MRIKNKLIISYVSLPLIITTFWIIYSFTGYNDFVDKVLLLSKKSLSEYTDQVIEISKNFIGPFSQKYIELETKDIANQVSPLIKYSEENNQDITLNTELKKILNQLIHMQGNVVVGYSYLINDKNQIIMSPNKNAIEITRIPWNNKFPELYTLFEDAKQNGISRGYYDFYDVDNAGIVSNVGKKYGVISVIPGTNYYLGTTVFLDNYKKFTLQETERLEASALIVIEENFTRETHLLLVNIILRSITTVIIIALLFIVIGYWIAKNISAPIQKLTDKVKNINSKNLNFSINENEYGTAETKELSCAFKILGNVLKEYKENLKKEIKARQIIDRELEIAREIQDHALPKVTDGFCKPGFKIYGELQPAKKVAGDFYDFYYLSKNKIAVIIGDVSGKGISAAYFMAKIKTLLKAFCMEETKNPAEVLYKVNNMLIKDNKAYMFATVFLGYYDIPSGKLIYANAGHHAAVKLDSNGTINEFGENENIVLGFFENSDFDLNIEQISIDETLILYTDGIYEAANKSNELYGKVRFFQNCIKNKEKPVKELILELVKDTKNFEGNKEQTDDITVLGLRRIF